MNSIRKLIMAGVLAGASVILVPHQGWTQEGAESSQTVAAPADGTAPDTNQTLTDPPQDGDTENAEPGGELAEESAAPAPLVAAPPRTQPTAGVGMPRPGEMTLQDQYTATGRQARWMHDALLLPVITGICLLVLGLMLFIAARYRRKANPDPSKTSHNTVLELVWTVAPILILVMLAVPSISLIAQQYKPAPRDALTVKVTGYQWYWGYEYPDQGIAEIISNMLPAEDAVAQGEPYLLGVDNRLVLPAGRPVKLIITAADVIHSFAVPSLWVKLDAVPGRLNEVAITIDKPGVYYGQCSELCGVRHGFMPIAIEALPPAEFDQWVRSQGGDPAGTGEAQTAAVSAAPSSI